MRTRTTLATTVAALAAALMVTVPLASPASAGHRDHHPRTWTETVTDEFKVWADLDHHLVAFVNITRAKYCTPDTVAFEEYWYQESQGNAEGDPPEVAPKTALRPVTITFSKDGPYTIARYRDKRVPIELWRMDRGKTLETLRGPCMDSDRVADGTAGTPRPRFFATGLASMSMRDNDAEEAGRAVRTWTARESARVIGPTGRYVWTHHWRMVAPAGEEPQFDFGATLRRR